MICPNCNNNLNGNEKFCGKCGTPIMPQINNYNNFQNQNNYSQVYNNMQSCGVKKQSNKRIIWIVAIIIFALILAFVLIFAFSGKESSANVSYCYAYNYDTWARDYGIADAGFTLALNENDNTFEYESFPAGKSALKLKGTYTLNNSYEAEMIILTDDETGAKSSYLREKFDQNKDFTLLFNAYSYRAYLCSDKKINIDEVNKSLKEYAKYEKDAIANSFS